VNITAISGDGGALPTDSRSNTASVAVAALLARLDLEIGLELRIEKGLPLCSGLGSSASSAAAALVAANHLLGGPLDRRQLLGCAVAAEAVACGVGHADNAAPALLGGFCLVRSAALDVVSLPIPKGLSCALVRPHCEVRTEDARRVLRKRVQLQDAVRQWGNVAGLVAGLCLGDYDLIGRSLQDELIEPLRSPLIPGFGAVKAAALEAGALGCSISGSGPTVFCLCRSEEDAVKAGQAMGAAFREAGLDSDLHLSAIDPTGARVLSE
jgi:homoserine kinase